MRRVYLDSNVFLYAIGTEHRYRDPCRTLIRAVGEGAVRAETSAETIQEIVHHRRRRADPDATGQGRRAAELCSAVHAVDRALVLSALRLIDRSPSLPTRDAVHAATALEIGALLVSTDSDFDEVDELERIDPADEVAVERLFDPPR